MKINGSPRLKKPGGIFINRCDGMQIENRLLYIGVNPLYDLKCARP